MSEMKLDFTYLQLSLDMWSVILNKQILQKRHSCTWILESLNWRFSRWTITSNISDYYVKSRLNKRTWQNKIKSHFIQGTSDVWERITRYALNRDISARSERRRIKCARYDAWKHRLVPVGGRRINASSVIFLPCSRLSVYIYRSKCARARERRRTLFYRSPTVLHIRY